MAVALVVTPLLGLHSNDLPFFIVAISTVPKLSNDQFAGSELHRLQRRFEPGNKVCGIRYHRCVTVSARVDPKTPLVIPVKSLLEIPV